MVIKEPCTIAANAGDFNNHPLNADCGSELDGTCFPGWHIEELTASARTFPALIPSYHAIHQDALYLIITNDFGTTTAFLKAYQR